MKRLIILFYITLGAACAFSASTIDPANPYGYAANAGWINARGDVINGAVIGQYFCSGYLYGANIGWISLGDGSPVNGIAYANNVGTDYGVNNDGLGNLTGYAYGANIGWVSFEQTYGQPKVDLSTGNLSGYIWSANIGWISLSNSVAHIRTLTIDEGPDSDSDGIADAWEYSYTNSLPVLGDGGADLDGDGSSDVSEYIAGTDPLDNSDYLKVTAINVLSGTNEVIWTCKVTRQYTLLRTSELTTNTINWLVASPAVIPSAGPTMSRMHTTGSATSHFYKVQVELPLAP